MGLLQLLKVEVSSSYFLETTWNVSAQFLLVNLFYVLEPKALWVCELNFFWLIQLLFCCCSTFIPFLFIDGCSIALLFKLSYIIELAFLDLLFGSFCIIVQLFLHCCLGPFVLFSLLACHLIFVVVG
jgi:hypothetical protein